MITVTANNLDDLRDQVARLFNVATTPAPAAGRFVFEGQLDNLDGNVWMKRSDRDAYEFRVFAIPSGAQNASEIIVSANRRLFDGGMRDLPLDPANDCRVRITFEVLP